MPGSRLIDKGEAPLILEDGSQMLPPTAIGWRGTAGGWRQDTVGEAISGADRRGWNMAGFAWLIQVLFQLAGIRDLGNDPGTAAINWESGKGPKE